jgi:hypothetical protein
MPIPIRISHDENQPSATIEIPLEKPLPEYDLEDLAQPTPRDVDAILVSQGFRDLVDDARGVLLDLLSNRPLQTPVTEAGALDITHSKPTALDLEQLTGAICSGDDEAYRPGLWIVLRDSHAKKDLALPASTRERAAIIAKELMRRLQLD